MPPSRRGRRPALPNQRSDAEIKEILEKIYEELMELGIFYAQHGGTVTNGENPFRNQDTNRVKMDRYREAVTFLGLEYLAVAMHSKQFQTCLFKDSDANWNSLLQQVEYVKHSLRMWAVTSQVPYVDNYNNSQHPQNVDFGPLNAHSLASAPIKPHQHLVYEAVNGNIIPCEYTERKKNPRGVKKGTITRSTKPMIALEDNLYTKHSMTRRKRPRSWPSAWPFPCDPQNPNKNRKPPFGPCEWCQTPIIWWPELKANESVDKCKCTRKDFLVPPMVQIKQYPSFNAISGTLNRGVVTRSRIGKGEAIGEYIGQFIHVDTLDSEPDQTYQFEFLGPFDQIPGSQDWTFMSPTSALVAGKRGNWARFVNTDRTGVRNNVEFVHFGLGGQMRITLKALRDIEFGEELLADYGPKHFKSDDEDEDEVMGGV